MSKTKMQLVDWLDDLCVRFIINLPQEELESVERICFQVEEAQWFYEDFIRPLDPSLPSMNLKKFCLLIFQHCPLLSDFSTYHHAAAYSEFLAYKTRVPVRGAIMLNGAMDEVVLVKGWKKGSRWGFPRGKINKDEKDLDCAVREVYEETGFDIQEAGLVKDESDMKFIEVTMREQHMRLYVFRGVPMDTHFEPRTRKEISKIEWYKLSDLPTQKKQRHVQEAAVDDSQNNSMFYMVAPFLTPLKRWIKHQRKLDRINAQQGQNFQLAAESGLEELEVAEESTALAGETTADEDASGAIRAARSSESHIDRLIAGLRTSEKSAEPASSIALHTALEPVPVDAAAELKRLLSVTNPSPSAEPELPSQINPLLAMLRGSDPAVGPASSAANPPPMTPLEQIANVPMQPRSPQHNHPRPPPLSAMPPPPSFPFPPSVQQPQRPYQPNQTHTSIRNQPLQGNPLHIHPPHGLRSNVMGIPVPQNGNSQPRFAAHGPAISQTIQEAPRPYQQTGDPQFVHHPQFTNVHGPAIPAASQLPPPKLNAHTLSLLNAFNNPEVAKAAIASHGQAKFAEIYNASKAHQEPSQPNQNRVADPQVSPNTLDSFAGGSSPPASQSPAPLIAAQQLPISTAQPKPRSAHQDALLNLFRAPSTSSASPLQSLIPHSLAPEPVELSAQPSPGVTRRPVLPKGAYAQLPPPPRISIPSLSEQCANTSPSLTSATVSGPLNEPNFDTLQRQRHTPQPHPAEANGKAIGSAEKEPTFPFRSSSAHSIENAPVTATPRNHPSTKAAIPVAPAKEDGPAKKAPFNPAILRQPNEMPSPATAAVFDRRENFPEQQKTALLSLFGKAPQLTSGVISPVSPLPEKGSLQQSPNTELPRSRISSITSAPAGEAATEIENNILKVIQKQQHPQKTPVTPVDRNFLLGYLEGVAKGERK